MLVIRGLTSHICIVAFPKEVDINGSTVRHSSSPGTSLGNSLAQHTTSLERAVSLNPSFDSLKGNPMESMEDPEAESIFSSVEGRWVCFL